MSDADITLLIPTYNRTAFLKRQLRYITKHLNSPNIQVEVLDGSDPQIAVKNAAICQDLNNSNITYKAYPASLHFYHREFDGISRAKTPFVALLPDDDFFNASGLQASIRFLKEHPDYSCAHGRYIGFRVGKANGSSDQHKLDAWKGYKRQQSLPQNDPFERLFQYFGNYAPVQYAVHRTDSLKHIFSEMIASVDLDDFKFFEFLIASLVVVSGKVKVLDDFYMARQADVSVSYLRTTIGQDIFHPEFSSRYQRFRQCLAQHLPNTATEEQKHQAIDIIFGQYVGTYLTPFYLQNRFIEWKRSNNTISKTTLKTTAAQATTTQATTTPTKDFGYLIKRLKQRLRHPKKLFPVQPEVTQAKHGAVLDFIRDYEQKTQEEKTSENSVFMIHAQ